MNEYEVFIEDINSCGGEQHAKKELLEIEADSPEAYVKESGSVENKCGREMCKRI